MTDTATANMTLEEFMRNEQAYLDWRRSLAYRADPQRKWEAATLGVVGGGRIGGRLAIEAVRSGASVDCWDFDTGTAENATSQITEVGVPKVESIKAACDAIRPDRFRAHAIDIRHAGIGQLRGCNLLLDCSDDPALTLSLTEISNGLGIDMLRLAVDGTGQLELGRVTHSSGAAACAMCSYSLEDVQRLLPRTGCPLEATMAQFARVAREIQRTLASGAICGGITHLGLLQAQRLIKAEGDDKVRGRELLLDWTNFQMFSIELRRSEACLSGHQRWTLLDLDIAADTVTLGELLAITEREVRSPARLAGYLHPLNTHVICECGQSTAAVGTDWGLPPACGQCGRRMQWASSVQVHQITRELASELNINDVPLVELGYPPAGAMFEARHGEDQVTRFVLR